MTQLKWGDIERYMIERFDKDSDVKAVLFVIGMREYGHKKQKFSKEEKQDLMNLAACKVMSLANYFEVSHLDAEGWPVWKQAKTMPQMTPQQQEEFIKEHNL